MKEETDKKYEEMEQKSEETNQQICIFKKVFVKNVNGSKIVEIRQKSPQKYWEIIRKYFIKIKWKWI